MRMICFRFALAGLLLAALAICGVLAAPSVAAEAGKTVEFQEMRFTLPAGEWERSPGAPPSRQVLFTLSQGAGRAQTLSIWTVDYPESMYGLTPEAHTTNIWNYEQFERPRPAGAWVDFARSRRAIAGKEYPIMTYQWRHPSASNPEAEAHGIFLAYFPDDFRSRERFYIFQWTDFHPPGATQHGWEWLDQVVAGFTVGPVQDRVAGTGTTLHKEFANVWYRPGDKGFSLLAYSASGKLVITETRLVFGAKDEALEIDVREIKSVSLGKMPWDIQNVWAIVRFGEPEKVAGFKDGSMLGSGKDTKLIYSTLKSAFEQRSVAPASGSVLLKDPKTGGLLDCSAPDPRTKAMLEAMGTLADFTKQCTSNLLKDGWVCVSGC